MPTVRATVAQAPGGCQRRLGAAPRTRGEASGGASEARGRQGWRSEPRGSEAPQDAEPSVPPDDSPRVLGAAFALVPAPVRMLPLAALGAGSSGRAPKEAAWRLRTR